MRSGFLSKAIATYLTIGGLWCLVTNVGAALTGAPSSFIVLSGGAPIADKLMGVLGVLVQQILLWPKDVLEKMGPIGF